MKTVSLDEARTDLPNLVDRAARGEAFVIADAGRPLVKVVAADVPVPGTQVRIGSLAGQISVPDDFDTMGAEDILAVFEGR